MILERVVVGSFGVNCYIIGDEKTKEAVIVDPGADAKSILSVVKKHDLKVKYIILTHAHGDHIGALDAVKAETNAPVYIHKDDETMLKDKNKNFTTMMGGKAIEMGSDQFAKDGDVIKLGDLELKIIHTPGHSRGGICILVENILVSGDSLFAGSIGRTDLDGGSYPQLIQSIKDKLMPLDDNVTVLPGHGPTSTIGRERIGNPFLN